MYRVPVEASRRLRVGFISLAAIAAMLAASVDDADARSKRKRGPAKKQVQSQQVRTGQPFIAARAASIVIDVNSGEAMHESNADALRHPASLTKIMTLYLLFEQLEAGKLRLNSTLPVSATAAAKPPTKLGVRPGQNLAVEDAIGALVTKSANDAATVIAEALADSEEEFARLMTRKAREIGMSQTVYRNASGLPNPQQVTTARDQALLGMAIQERFPRYYRYFSTRQYNYAGKTLRNHNRLLGQVEGVDGIKTGYTNASGFNLVTSVKRGNRHMVAVVLGGSTGAARDARMRSLLEGHIMEASVRRTAPSVFAQAPALRTRALPVDEPVEVSASRPQLASATSIPISLEPPAAARPSQRPGSTEPIKPVSVKTVMVRTPGGRSDALPRPPAPVQTASLGPVAIPQQSAEPPVPAAPRAGVLGVLPAAMAAAGKAAVSSAKAAETPTASAPVSARSGWAIQIGAFPGEAEAKQKISIAKSKALSVLRKADPYTEKTASGSRTLYRARFAGFDRDEADAACKQLKRNNISCLAIKI